MAFARELPHSFAVALQMAKRILSSSSELVAKGVIDAEAEILVSAAYRLVSGKDLSRVELFARMQDAFPAAAGEKLITWAMARAEGKPLQHLTGVQAFLEHEYEVGPEVLVPRPETEVLLTESIAELRKLRCEPMLGLELGVGSGILSIELLAAFPSLKMVASEFSARARARALANARRILGDAAARLEVRDAPDALSVWGPFESGRALPRADFLISNPPYLAPEDTIDAEVLAHEPREALFAPEGDPLYFYRELIERAPEFLKPGGFLFFELAAERAGESTDLARSRGFAARLVQDLTGRDRVLIARLEEKNG